MVVVGWWCQVGLMPITRRMSFLVMERAGCGCTSLGPVSKAIQGRHLQPTGLLTRPRERDVNGLRWLNMPLMGHAFHARNKQLRLSGPELRWGINKKTTHSPYGCGKE